MIFETLWESAQRGELLLIDGGFCHWHLRRDAQYRDGWRWATYCMECNRVRQQARRDAAKPW